jgi:AGCS family alanine or glycine:cation symporter
MTNLKYLLTAALLFFSTLTFAADTPQLSFSDCLSSEAHSLDLCIDSQVTPVSNLVASIIFSEIPITQDFGVRWIVLWLVGGGLFFTFYLRFVPIWGFKHAIDVVRGKFQTGSPPGELTPFQALTAALSGTVGLGNIAGVAVAVSVGGPGATFWMITAGILGMSLKFAECTLGVKYRDVDANGGVSGGPKYYLTRGLIERGIHPLVGRVLATLFAICCIGAAFGAGNMFQSNQAFAMTVKATGGEASFFYEKGWAFGLIISFLLAMVIVGGIKSIGRVTSKLVPFMATIYLITGLFIVLMHIQEVPAAFYAIFSGAFSAEGIVGGVLGALIQGFQRAVFSNEAGVGSASIAHSAVSTDEPASEGFVALLEPFIDTVVICTMTSLVIVITGSLNSETSLSGVDLTAAAFTSVFPWFESILAMAVILFAFSTMLSWSYYGIISWTFLFGQSSRASITFKILFCLFTVFGAMASLDSVITFSDSMIFAMALINILGLYLLAPILKNEVQKYKARYMSK